MIHEVALVVHSYLRWIVLAAGLAVVLASGFAWIRRQPWSQYHTLFSKVWISAFDLQVLFGLVLYIWLSPAAAAARHAGGAMKNSILRFWLVEHAVGMLAAVFILH